MDQNQEQLENLHEIRNIMDRSSRFISLSGLSGVSAGISALLGAAVVKWHLAANNINYTLTSGSNLTKESIIFLISAAILVFVLALGSAIYFTVRNARKNSDRVWDAMTERMLVNLLMPLAAGGIFCAVLLYHGIICLVAPCMLIFYGLALLNASKYTLKDIRYLSFLEIILGLVAGFFTGYGLLAWTVGFGVLHILYGTLMYFKYER